MRAILVYDLPEDKDDLTFALNGGKYYSALFDITQELHRMSKQEKFADKMKDPQVMIEYIRDLVLTVISERCIDLEEVL